MSLLLRNYGETDFITGLRCIAAVMVIAIHSSAFRDFGWLGNIITDNGRFGVQIFFVISGFTIARTYRTSGGFGPYFGRRLMRIAPLYFAVILLAFALIRVGWVDQGYWMTKYGSAPDAYNLLMHFTFLSAWDVRVANSLLGVEWSIPIEVFWYAVLPLVLPISDNARRRLAIFVGLLVLSGLTRAGAHLWLPSHAAHFLPLTYGAYFYLGAMAETWRSTARDMDPARRQNLTRAAVVLFILGLTTDTGFSTVLLATATVGLIVFRDGSDVRRGFLGQRALIFLGSISYSLYLMHPIAGIVISAIPALQVTHQLGVFLVMLGVTIPMSVLTYTLIEHPSNTLGRRLFGRKPDQVLQ